MPAQLPLAPRPRRRAGTSRPDSRRRSLLVGTVVGLVAATAAVIGALLVATAGGGPVDDELARDGATGVRGTLLPDDEAPGLSPGDDPSGKPLPDRSFPMLDGGTGSFADYRGRPLVVNFFASWCAPCVQEMPDFERVHQDVGAGVAFLGINLQDRPEDARELVERTGVTYDIGVDRDGEVFAALDGFTMPTTIFVAPDGTVLESRGGMLTESELRAALEELFGP